MIIQQPPKTGISEFDPWLQRLPEQLANIGNVVNVKDHGAIGDNVHDDTIAINAAIGELNSTTYQKKRFLFEGGVYKVTGALDPITCSEGAIISGYGRRASRIITNNSTADVFSVTLNQSVVFENLGIESSVTKTDGSLIKIDNNGSGSNVGSVFKHLNLIKGYMGIEFVAAHTVRVDDCYVINSAKYGMKIENDAAGDAGDSTIVNSVFDNALSTSTIYCIYQVSSGGLKIIGNKFLHHGWGYVGNFDANTSILLIEGNSFENYGTGGVDISENGATFNKAIINGNQFTCGDGYGVRIADIGQVTIEGNQFTLDLAGAQPIRMNSCIGFFIGGNYFQAAAANEVCIYLADGLTYGRVGINEFTNSTVNPVVDNTSSATVQIDRKQLSASKTWDIPDTADGAVQQTTITVTGAVIGDPVSVGMGPIVGFAWMLAGQVSSANTVTVTALNKTGGNSNPASGTLYVTVMTKQ